MKPPFHPLLELSSSKKSNHDIDKKKNDNDDDKRLNKVKYIYVKNIYLQSIKSLKILIHLKNKLKMLLVIDISIPLS